MSVLDTPMKYEITRLHNFEQISIRLSVTLSIVVIIILLVLIVKKILKISINDVIRAYNS